MDWRQDLRIAFRSLRRRPRFALVAIATLGLGIGATTATFGIVRAVLLSPLPYVMPGELALIWGATRDAPDQRRRIAGEDAVRVVLDVPGIVTSAFVLPAIDVLVGDGAARSHARLGPVTSALFDVLGTRLLLGPGFRLDAEASVGRFSSIILTHEFWQDRFGGDASIVGRDVVVDGTAIRVAGVAPPDFAVLLPSGAGLAASVDGWLSIGSDPGVLTRPSGLRDQDSDDTGVLIVRLASGSSAISIGGPLAAVSERIRADAEGLDEAGFELFARPMHDDVVRDARPALAAIAGAVAFVLLVACFNVASLLIARLNARSGELALRAALGANRTRLFVQAMGESLIIATAGGVVGLLLAGAPGRSIGLLDLGSLTGQVPATFDSIHIGFAAVLTVVAALASGVGPALRAASMGRATLAGTSSRVTGGSVLRTRRFLVGAQIAFSLVLLTAAGLLLRSFVALQHVETGFDARNLVTFGVTLPPGTVGGPAARARLMRDIADAVRDVPGVQAVGLSGALPLTGSVWMQPWGLASQTPDEWEGNTADFRVISSDYFEAAGTRVLAGRAFTGIEDLNEDDRVAIVDRELARLVRSDGNVIGQTIAFPLDGRPVQAEIVGVVEPVRHASLRDPGRPTIYVPYRQEASRTVGFAVRTRTDAGAALGAIRQAIDGAVSGTSAVLHDERLMSDWVDRATARERFTVVIASGFAAAALLLAGIGLYGVIAFLVNRRTREMGIRSALGATANDLTSEVLKDGVRLAGTGAAAGILIAIAFAFAMRSLLFGVSFFDPLTLGLVTVGLGGVALLACWVPARRASRVQPIVALRID